MFLAVKCYRPHVFATSWRNSKQTKRVSWHPPTLLGCCSHRRRRGWLSSLHVSLLCASLVLQNCPWKYLMSRSTIFCSGKLRNHSFMFGSLIWLKVYKVRFLHPFVSKKFLTSAQIIRISDPLQSCSRWCQDLRGKVSQLIRMRSDFHRTDIRIKILAGDHDYDGAASFDHILKKIKKNMKVMLKG